MWVAFGVPDISRRLCTIFGIDLELRRNEVILNLANRLGRYYGHWVEARIDICTLIGTIGNEIRKFGWVGNGEQILGWKD